MKQNVIFISLKYGFSALIMILALSLNGYFLDIIFGAALLAGIFLLSDFLVYKHKGFFVLNSILLLLFNIEYLFLLFGRSFVSLIMIENVNSLEDLSGKLLIYGFAFLLCVALSFLPIKSVINESYSKIFAQIILAAFIVIALSVLGVSTAKMTPVYGIKTLTKQISDKRKLNKMIAAFSDSSLKTEDSLEANPNPENVNDTEEITGSLTSIEDETLTDTNEDNNSDDNDESIIETNDEEDVSDEPSKDDTSLEEAQEEALDKQTTNEPVFVPSPKVNVSTPNIILIFTEGLSENVLTDPRNILPNVSSLIPNSISFTDYYNHTFATYRGLQGQLFSGHQFEALDSNSLPALPDVLREKGYHSVYLNSEPYNADFSKYVSELHFDNVITDAANCEGLADSITDKRMYELLWETVNNLGNTGQPFFACMYTLGTHMSFDSPDEKFGDGSLRFLNRFYNMDYQFGLFLNNFINSPLYDNTILVFTSDHASFGDSDFTDAFPDYLRANIDCDKIPLIFYSKPGVLKQEFIGRRDVLGRNSLTLAPTLLDILGYASPNTFLGTSLFSTLNETDGASLEHFFWDAAYMLRTDSESIREVNDFERWTVSEKIAKYFSIK